MNDAILQSDAFKSLVKNRWTVSIAMTLVMLLAYFGFILTVAFHKEVFAAKVSESLTLGMVCGLGIILFAWLITGIYVWWANNHYDDKVADLKAQLGAKS